MANSLRLVYLAGPVDLDYTNDKLQWRHRASRELAEHNICSYNPPAAFRWVGGTHQASKLIRINEMALRQSDAMLLHLNSTITIGSIRELQQAINLNMPVVLWTPGDAYAMYENSLYLAGIQRHDTLEDAIRTLVNTPLHHLTAGVV